MTKRERRVDQIDTRAVQLSPVRGFFAEAAIVSVPARFAMRRLTSNEPLGAVVVRVPVNTVTPLSLITTFHA
jgi:hypothetical protein